MIIVAGVDCGAETTKVVIWSSNGQGFHIGPLLQNRGNTIEGVVTKALDKALKAADLPNEIKLIIATGSMASKLRRAHSPAPEPLCLARGVNQLLPTAHTIIDGGAAKVLVVKHKGGIPSAVAYNDRCAGGSGTYLEMAAEVLGVSVAELGEIALRGKETVSVQSTCAVFAESEIISLIHSGKKLEDIAKGVVTSCANRIYPLLRSVRWEKDVAIVGGTAKNAALVKAFEGLIGSTVIVSEHVDFYPALGAALIAKERASNA